MTEALAEEGVAAISGIAAVSGVGSVEALGGEGGVASPTLVWLPSLLAIRLFKDSTVYINSVSVFCPAASFTSCFF